MENSEFDHFTLASDDRKIEYKRNKVKDREKIKSRLCALRNLHDSAIATPLTRGAARYRIYNQLIIYHQYTTASHTNRLAE